MLKHRSEKVKTFYDTIIELYWPTNVAQFHLGTQH